MAEGVVDDISHEGLRVLLREEGVSFQVIKTFKVSNDPDFEAKKNRVLELYDLADGKTKRRRGDPHVVICVDEFGPLNLQPHPGKQWAPIAAGKGDQRRRGDGDAAPPITGRTGCVICSPAMTCRPIGSTGTSRPQGPHRVPRVLPLPAVTCIHPRCGSRSCSTTSVPHLSTKKDTRVGEWAAANNVELAYVPFYASWLNRIEAQFQALRYFALDGTDHAITRRAGTHDSPLHRLAEPQRPRPSNYVKL